uniref:Cellulose synthase n=1 Tax=Ciona savignyi TaxID=51511 RepID=Q6RCS2_CIOSA|nr:cellulose synthase [Ciona savignyi]
MSRDRRHELPGAYRRSEQPGGRSLPRSSIPPKPSRYTSSSFATSENDFGPDHFNFNDSDTSASRSRVTSTLPSGQGSSGFSRSGSEAPPIPDSKRRTISMGANLQPPRAKRSMGGRHRDRNQTLPPYSVSDSSRRTMSGNDENNRFGSDGSSVYSSADSFDSQDDFDRRFPPRPPKPDKYKSSSSSNFTGQFYPDPMQSADLGRLQSGYSEDTNTTITNGNSRPTNLDELAEYFNKKLEDVQRQADSAMNRMQNGRNRSQRSESTQDSSVFSYPSGPSGGRHTIRPTNRAGISSDASTITPTNSRSYQTMESSQPTESSISAVRDEIESLKSQLSRGLDNMTSRGESQDMDEMADYFSKRLEECQNQVYKAVNQVQGQMGEPKRGFEPRQSRHRQDWENRDDEFYDSSDSGIGPRNLTIRPLTRAHANALENNQPPSVQNQHAPPVLRHREQDRQRNHRDNYRGVQHRDDRHVYPPPLPQDDEESFSIAASEKMHEASAPPVYRDHGDFPQLEPMPDDDNFSLGSDDENDWDDYEDFIDDDTPAPETATPVPPIIFKGNNYVYQCLYITYIISFLAYVFVRIQYTLDSPGLNRIYCIVVAILEIITAPSLILQGMCLWKWVSREPAPADAFMRPKFHTARIMVPTYKEPLEVVAGTVHEIVHMDLPPYFHVHVYVLDDGRRESLENWVLSKRTKRCVYLHYVARTKLPGVPHHAKAGNINHTLHYVFDDAYAEQECVIIFDADFMPRRNYLLRVLPVFSEKRTRPIALVQTPQFFYNVNSDEDVWDHLNVSFFHRIEPSLDRWSAVNCCGTNFTVRADALKDVGYFPVGCLTEDTLLSLRLCTMGWGVAYHHEVLAIGQSPHEITEIFKQRSRWCKGNLQIFLDEFPLMQSGLSISQRVFYSSCGFNYFCASISIPFFQLVPAWAIFFGLWPVSKIGLEFAFAFFIYYLLGNMLLLYPPPGFGIKDMWNGELASTNLWFTYFNGVRRIVGTKLLKGKGELTFKTTKKKTDDEEGNNVGFQKEDVRACYMHFIMFFIMLITIIYAIVKAVTAKNVKFYFYYMYMIGMSWALINMTPYLIVVIYCWYRVRIPGIMVACFRNVQLLLRLVCAALILVQAFTTRNMTENFVCPHEYTGQLGSSPLAMVKTLDVSSKLHVTRNAFWLLGLTDDFYTIQQIKQTACNEDEIPVIVFFMRPSTGLELDAESGHYMPVDRIENWSDYDLKLENYAKQLADVPSLIVMEPSLLMHTFNSQTSHHASGYQLDYAQRVGNAVRMFPKSWIYVDAGNAMYLQWNVNLNHVISVLKKMPSTIRGFSINVGSFVNSTYNEILANEIHCQTGYHYIIDTSRNGGEFSTRSLDDINSCTYDPPRVKNGSMPMWKDGSAVTTLRTAGSNGGATAVTLPSATAVPSVKKRWVLNSPTDMGDSEYYGGDYKYYYSGNIQANLTGDSLNGGKLSAGGEKSSSNASDAGLSYYGNPKALLSQNREEKEPRIQKRWALNHPAVGSAGGRTQ